MYRHVCIALTAAVIMAAGAAGCRNESGRAAERPAPVFTIPPLADRAPGLADREFAKVKEHYAHLRERITTNPTDIEAYVDMAQLFLQEGRVTGKHHVYLPQAMALLDEALGRKRDDFGATVTKASVMMTLHRFKEAEELASRAVASNRYSAFAYGVLCDARVEMGRYEEAAKTCDTMVSIRPDLRSYARVSYLRELHGDRAGAAQAMMMAADAGVGGQEDRAWTLYNLGTLYLNQGKLDTAAYIFKGILEERPNYAFAIGGLAAVSAARGVYADAIAHLVQATQLSPEHLFIEQLSDIYLAMGDTANARTLEAKALDAFTQHENDGWNIDREYALYCTNHGINAAESEKRARREYQRRPENIDALDTYAWVLYNNGRAQQAVPLIEQALRLGSAQPMLHYHAGMIYRAAGERRKSDAQLRDALRENPYLAQPARARAQAALAGRDMQQGMASK